MGEPWQPRAHDHLVEPLLGGLGHGAAPQDPNPVRRRAGVGAPWVLLVAGLVSALAWVALSLMR